MNMALLNHLKHPHTLVLSEEKYSEDHHCMVCSDNVVGLCYCCNECAFVVHKWCADLPLEVKYRHHMQHPLVLLSYQERGEEEYKCIDCRETLGLSYAFGCKECSYFLHLECALLPKHPEFEYNDEDSLPASDLPLEVKYRHHMQHPLVLLSYEERGEEEYECIDCRRTLGLSSAFGCKECSYFLHPKCVLWPKQITLEFEYNDANSKPTRKFLEFRLVFGTEYPCGICKQQIGEIFFEIAENLKPCFYDAENTDNRYHFHCLTLPKTVKHEKHIHDFTLQAPIEKEKTFYVNNVCNLCEKERDPEEWLYYCEKCDFPGHLSCGLLGSPVPNKGILTSNFVYIAEEQKPSLAQKKEMEYLSWLETRSKRTEENSEPVGELVHFSHEHPLFLFPDIWDKENNCSVCGMSVHGLVYSCHECEFYLHKWCAELPQEVHFGFHFEHPLTLMQTDKLGCSYCRIYEYCSYYCCLECGFGVHTTCAFLPKFGLHSSHDHPLEIICVSPEKRNETWLGKFPLKSGLTLPCNACLFPCRFWSLGCTDCGFYLHVSCYLYPTTRKAETHRHNLNLTYAYEEPFPEFMCDTCEKPRTANCWVYCCPDPKCSIVAHLDCGEPILFPSSSYNEMIKHQEDSNECRCATCDKERDPNDWVHCCPSLLLQLGLERSNLDQPIQRILKSDPAYAFLKENVTGNMPKPEELRHFSHEHVLVLCDEKWNGEICCEVCSRGIYGKTYICNECGYYLHKWCAQIPREMHFRCHSEHPLTLLGAHDFECSVCKANNFGFSFSCERCDFEVDPLCILKPDSKLESHKHPTDIMIYMPENSNRVNTGIYPVKKGEMPLCNACWFPCEGMAMQCRSYPDTYLHVGCAWYPDTCETEAHMHSLTLYDERNDLMYISPKYLCDVCDKRLTGISSCYICLDEKCNLTAVHLDCAIPNPFLTSSFKPILMHQELL